jgi:hypothetical protein
MNNMASMEYKSNNNHKSANLAKTVVVFSFLLILIQTTLIEDASALTRYINCVTKVANGNGTVSLYNVEACYDKVFKGAHDADEFGNKIGNIPNTPTQDQ